MIQLQADGRMRILVGAVVFVVTATKGLPEIERRLCRPPAMFRHDLRALSYQASQMP